MLEEFGAPITEERDHICIQNGSYLMHNSHFFIMPSDLFQPSPGEGGGEGQYLSIFNLICFVPPPPSLNPFSFSNQTPARIFYFLFYS